MRAATRTSAPPTANRSDNPSRAAILLVDDNAGKRLAFRAVLEPLGYPIVEADSGRAALRCLLVRDFAVILLDVRMPMMDGFETAGLIRQRRQSEMTPIIFITAYAVDELGATDRYAEGAVDFMFAPVPPEELRAKVKVFLALYDNAEKLATSARQVQTTADQLRLLTEAAPIGIFQTDRDNRYVYTNPRWSELTGLDQAAVLGQSWDTMIDPAEQGGGVTELVTHSPSPTDLSHRFRVVLPTTEPSDSGVSDHGFRVLQLTARSIPDVAGGITGWVGTLADVTAEVAAGQLAAIVEHSEDAMLTATSDGVITSWNRGAEQLFGYTRAEIVGRNLARAAAPEDVRFTLARIIGGSGVERYQTTEVHRDGTQREVSVSAFPIRSTDGSVVGRSAVCRDVTAAARLESEQASLRGQLHLSQRLESLGQLAGGVAHDFNNLLAVISGSAELIDAESDQPEAVRADVAVIASAAARAGGLTRQLLAFARGEPVPVQNLDVADVVRGIASLLERTVGAPITVELVATSARSPLVRADRGRLEQVLLNLAVNARDAMPDGGTLTIATGLVELVERQHGLQPPPSSGTYVELAVTDTGVGMTAETVSHIFEPFYTTKERDSGTGLGLATVYGVVADAEGSIAVESTPEQGTTFRVFLPIAD